MALLALAVRVALPAGTMLAQVDDGRFFTIILCTGSGPVETVLDLKTGHTGAPAPDQPMQDAHAPCAFAATAEHFGPTSPPAIIALDAGVPLRSTVSAAGQPALILGLAAPPPWATAPPRAT